MKKLFSLLILVALFATLTILVACKQETPPEYKGPESEVPHVHKYDKLVEVKPTCCSEGYTEHTCKDCGYYYRDKIKSIDSKNHTDWKTTVTKANDCTEKDVTVRECLGCGEKEIKYGASPACVYPEQPFDVKNPTCTTDGYYKYECTICKGIKTVTRYATKHSWGEWIIDIEATCSHNSVSEGLKHRECTATGCDAVEKDVVILPHTSKAPGKVVAPTCTTVGYIEYVCDDCGVVYHREYKDALGHQFCPKHEVEGKPGVWCTHCEVCGYSKLTNE